MRKLLTIFGLFLLSFDCLGQATGLVLTDFPTGGSIGTAPTTYEVAAFINIPQTTAGQTLTIANPTNVLAGKNFTINNTGSVSFVIVPGGTVYPGEGVIYRWTGAWSTTGTGNTQSSHNANLFLATPDGSSGYPSYRAITVEDVPFGVGIVEDFAGTTAPAGYLMCDGSAISRTTYARLFAVIGTIYGAGDGSTTFNLPNPAQRFVLGKSTSGTGSTLGATGGAIDFTVTVDPASVNTSSDGSHNHTGVTGTPSGTSGQLIGVINVASDTHTHTISSDGAHTHSVDVGSTVSSSTNPAYIVFNKIIKY